MADSVDVDYLVALLRDLADFTDRHRVTYPDHEHDCYEEWSVFKGEVARVSRLALGAQDTPALCKCGHDRGAHRARRFPPPHECRFLVQYPDVRCPCRGYEATWGDDFGAAVQGEEE